MSFVENIEYLWTPDNHFFKNIVYVERSETKKNAIGERILRYCFEKNLFFFSLEE